MYGKYQRDSEFLRSPEGALLRRKFGAVGIAVLITLEDCLWLEDDCSYCHDKIDAVAAFLEVEESVVDSVVQHLITRGLFLSNGYTFCSVAINAERDAVIQKSETYRNNRKGKGKNQKALSINAPSIEEPSKSIDSQLKTNLCVCVGVCTCIKKGEGVGGESPDGPNDLQRETATLKLRENGLKYPGALDDAIAAVHRQYAKPDFRHRQPDWNFDLWAPWVVKILHDARASRLNSEAAEARLQNARDGPSRFIDEDPEAIRAQGRKEREKRLAEQQKVN